MNITHLSKEEKISFIINQANSLNKKVKLFESKGITEHKEMVTGYLMDNIFNNKGTITKSKKTYNNMSELKLNVIANKLHMLNNHDTFGTLNKYETEKERRWNNSIETVKDMLLSKGYPPSEVNRIVYSKDFQNDLFIALKNVEEYDPSDDTAEQVFLDYYNNADIEKRLNNLEDSISKRQELNDINNQFENYMKGLNK